VSQSRSAWHWPTKVHESRRTVPNVDEAHSVESVSHDLASPAVSGQNHHMTIAVANSHNATMKAPPPD
jgi:hypothetical protein